LKGKDVLSENVRNAVELRRGEKRILLFALSRYQRQLKRLEKEAGNMGKTTAPAEEDQEEEEEESAEAAVRRPKKKKKRKRNSRRRNGEGLSRKSEL
jgi:hypothetical protein